jgi:hypothetical protein
MLTELRYQAKRHAISKTPRENKSCKFSPFFFKNKKKQNNKQYGKDIICKGKIKPVYAQ